MFRIVLLAVLIPLAAGQDADVERLADESYEVREAATSALIARGRAVLPVVRELYGSGDPEILRRAHEVAIAVRSASVGRARRLLEQPVSLEFAGEVGLIEALEFLRDGYDLPLVVLPLDSTDASYRIKIQNMTAREALDLLCGPTGWTVSSGAVLVGDPLALRSAEPVPEPDELDSPPGSTYYRAEEALLDRASTLGGEIHDVVSMLADASGQNIRIEGPTSTYVGEMDFHSLSLLEALWVLRVVFPFEPRFEDDEIVLVAR